MIALKTRWYSKGGQLKKCYFGRYRFSEDLDFSALPESPAGKEMETAIKEVCADAVSLLDAYAPIVILSERYEERDPHPGGQEAFVIHGQMPWQRRPITRIKVEISMDEKIIKPIRKCSIIHEYGEPIDAEVNTYALEEIVAEKLRAILQHTEKIETRGWARSRSRDFYDLWRLFNSYSENMDFNDFPDLLRKKCEVRKVVYTEANDFFKESMLRYVEKTWEQWLGPLLSDLPTFKKVISELRPRIEAILA